MNRRSFFAALANPPPPATVVVPKMTTRTGGHGEQVSLLGYGAMRYPTVDGSHANNFRGGSNAPIDLPLVQRQIDYCIEHGVNYFDTSPAYCRGESEKVLGDALAKHPREKWFVATKLSLLHSIGGGGKDSMKVFNGRFIDNGMLDFLLKEREAGRIRNLGFSFHGDEAVFRHALAMHDKVHWDFVQIQLNWVDWHHAKEVNPRNVNAETLYKLLDERAIPAVIMEPLLGGRLARVNERVMHRLVPLDPEATPAQWAFRFAGSFPRVLTVLSGMTYLEHVKENVKTYSPLRPLARNEFDTLEHAARVFLSDDTIPCTACDYCMPCPYGIDIPGLFGFWGDALVQDRLPDDPSDPAYAENRRRFLIDYERAFPKLRRAERCTGCGRCSPHCPQGIDIPAMIRKVDRFVEKLRRNGRA